MSSGKLRPWIEANLRVDHWEGDEASVHCPYPEHPDEVPSFRINADKGAYYCHGCGRKGNVYVLARDLQLPKPPEFKTNGKGGWQGLGEPVAEYQYTLNGKYYCTKLKFLPPGKQEKTFRIKNLNGKPAILYRVDEVRVAVKAGGRILVAEGEKDVDRLKTLGYTATCNMHGASGKEGGASKWTKENCAEFPAGTNVVILPDADTAGQVHSRAAADMLTERGCTVKILDLGYEVTESHGKDVSDWLNDGHKKEELEQLMELAPIYEKEDFIDLSLPKSVDNNPYFSQTASEMGTALRLLEMYRGDVLFDHTSGRWLLWDGNRYAPDQTLTIYEVVRHCLERLRALGKALPDNEDNEDFKKAFIKYLNRAENCSHIKHSLELATAFREVAVLFKDLDRDKNLLNCNNGTINLVTGELLEHDRKYKITRLAPVDYDPTAQCPRFERFMKEITGDDPEIIAYLQCVLGYGLTGETREQTTFFWVGEGDNGKTTLINVDGEIMGTYALETPIETFLTSGHDGVPNDVARLNGARMVHGVEPEEGRKLRESRLKQFAGSDEMTGRYLNHEFFTFIPCGKLILGMNEKIEIKGDTYGTWRKIRMIPFNVRIRDVDKELPEKLRVEYPGILAWLVRGAVDWYRNGLQTPDIVLKATAAYRSEMDILGQFADEECNKTPGARTRGQELYSRYKVWAKANTGEVWTSNKFSRRLEKKFRKKQDETTRLMVFLDVTLRHEDFSLVSETVRSGG